MTDNSTFARRWTIRLGWCFLIAGAVWLSPLPDLLPVDLWARLDHMGQQRTSQPLFRVVPSVDHPAFAGPLLIVAGLVLIGMGKLRGRR